MSSLTKQTITSIHGKCAQLLFHPKRNRRMLSRCLTYTRLQKIYKSRRRIFPNCSYGAEVTESRDVHGVFSGAFVTNPIFPCAQSNESTLHRELHLGDFEDELFNSLCDEHQRLSVGRFKEVLTNAGLKETDPRLEECIKNLHQMQQDGGPDGPYVDKYTFKRCVADNIVMLSNIFRNNLIIPEFKTFTPVIDEIYQKAKSNVSGEVATYIPQLARYSPEYWGISLCTTDGQRHSIGNSTEPFCLQSVSKPLIYSLVLEQLGHDTVHRYVGQEPSGKTFNEISLDYSNKPHNPLLNSGAMVMCSLLNQDLNLADRYDYVANNYRKMAGGEYIGFNNAIFLSERETADRNFAIGYYLRENKCFPKGINLMECMDSYFQACSMEVTTESGSVIAATLANGGICPITGDKVISPSTVRNTLSLMHSCGMYDYSGQFAFKVGLPAKSGVSGAIMLVIPNVMGVFMWSPPLDQWGNSCRGIQFSCDLVDRFNFHNYDNLTHTAQKMDPRRYAMEYVSSHIISVLFSAYNDDVTALRRFFLSGADMNLPDYDGRTALHIAAAEGHLAAVLFLLDKCKACPHAQDRWGFKPIDDAKRFGYTVVADVLEKYMAKTDKVVQEETLPA